MLLIAVLLGWRASNEKSARQATALRRQIEFAQANARWSESRAEMLKRDGAFDRHGRFLYQSDLSGVRLRRGIVGDEGAGGGQDAQAREGGDDEFGFQECHARVDSKRGQWCQ